MNDFFTRLGFPAPEQRDSIRFYFAKGLTYRARKILILASLIAGLVLQIILMRIWPGILLILIGVSLGLVKGYDSRIRLKNFKNDETWTEVGIEEIREIERVRQKSRQWDRDALDVTNSLGCMTLVLLVALGLGIGIFAGAAAGDHRVTGILLGDYFLLVFPFYFTGVRWALKQGNLAIKVRLILKLHEHFRKKAIESETFVPMMLIAREKEDKTIPVDVRVQIRYRGLPPDRFSACRAPSISTSCRARVMRISIACSWQSPISASSRTGAGSGRASVCCASTSGRRMPRSSSCAIRRARPPAIIPTTMRAWRYCPPPWMRQGSSRRSRRAFKLGEARK